MHIVVRPMDNLYLDRLIRSYRTMHGNKTVAKDEFVRGLISAMKANEVVGILMDTNVTPPQGVFVDFFGIPACTASGLARIALRTDAAVIPGFTIWDKSLGKYSLRFEAPVDLIRTGNLESDIQANTQKFTKIIEDYVRQYPDQWLWVHRRWKARPPRRPAAVLKTGFGRRLSGFSSTVGRVPETGPRLRNHGPRLPHSSRFSTLAPRTTRSHLIKCVREGHGFSRAAKSQQRRGL